jgi:hypothetical protein
MSTQHAQDATLVPAVAEGATVSTQTGIEFVHARNSGTEPVCEGCGLELVLRDGEWHHKVGDVPRCQLGVVRPDEVILVAAGDVWRKGDKVRVIGSVVDRYYKDRESTAYDGFSSRIYWAGPGKRPTRISRPSDWARWAIGATREPAAKGVA